MESKVYELPPTFCRTPRQEPAVRIWVGFKPYNGINPFRIDPSMPESDFFRAD